MKKLFHNIAIIASLALGTACAETVTEQQAASYEALKITLSDTEVESRFAASVRGRQDIDIVPQVSGTISKVCVSEGAVVKEGDKLFIIDQVPYKAALQSAEANVKAAEASVDNAKITLESKRKLYENNVISEYELHLAENQLLTAKASLLQAEAALTNAANNLSYTEVKSPANGVVGTIPFRVGALVGPSMGQALTTVSDNSEMYVYFSMNESQLLKLTRTHGTMEAAIAAFPKPVLQLSDGSIYEHEGYVESISGVINSSTGSVSIRAVFPNPGRILLSGSSANVIVRYFEADCIVIPCIATFELQDKVFVYMPVDGKAKAQMINVSRYDGTHYIVREGLREGDTIISEGVAMLREGAAVNIVEENAAAKNEIEE
ncbi:MAG: efflux RND transporter periplasmic adaptor subunit [Alistipes sp.]|nr:efflux RND transporter periplasmic adaptor subunit [Alistipes sp.]